MSFVVPFEDNREYDSMFEKIILKSKNRITKYNDEMFIFCTGLTGSGKSSLALHAFELFNGKDATVSNIAFDPEQFADSLHLIDSSGKDKFALNDEANVQRHNWNTKFNKDIIDLYFSIRGKNFFHWWNNPSADILQRIFIEEIVKGVIFVYDKNMSGKPRRYMYFTKDGILKLLRDKKDLKTETLMQYGKKYCSYIGWFKKYNGFLYNDYLKRKNSRMTDKLLDFKEKYGSSNLLSSGQVGKLIGRGAGTINKYREALIEKGEIKEGVHFFSKGGRYQYTTEFVSFAEKQARINRGSMMHNLKFQDGE